MKSSSPPQHRYIEWISPDEMHQDALDWLSELKFAKDEQKFLNNLVKSYTLQLTDSRIFPSSRGIVSGIASAEKKLVPLMKQVQSHVNLLEIMVDDIDQPKMEKAYKASHSELLEAVRKYLKEYQALKKGLFSMISGVLKKEKQKRLLH